MAKVDEFLRPDHEVVSQAFAGYIPLIKLNREFRTLPKRLRSILLEFHLNDCDRHNERFQGRFARAGHEVELRGFAGYIPLVELL